eukprot:5424306-Pyramimonas_sp.AAC.1
MGASPMGFRCWTIRMFVWGWCVCGPLGIPGNRAAVCARALDFTRPALRRILRDPVTACIR